MAPRSRGVERLITASISPRISGSVCRSCRQTLAQQRYASTATAQVTVEAPPVTQVTPDHPLIDPSAQPRYTVKAGVLLTRAPLITPDPHPFEKAFHLYQRRLNERLVLPFTQYFYYKRNTQAFEHWRKNKAARNGTAARDVGKYNAYEADSWNDEVLIGDDTANPKRIMEQLVAEEGRGTEFAADSGLEHTGGLRRTTKADEENNTRSLERSLDRTLYLLVKEKDSENWIFPSGVLVEKEGIAEAAKRVLADSCGVNMNTWQVARHPVGYYVQNNRKEAKEDSLSESKSTPDVQTDTSLGEKTFFIKTRIFAGQADLDQAVRTWEDFAWLAREEIEKAVHPRYWARVKNMLADQ